MSWKGLKRPDKYHPRVQDAVVERLKPDVTRWLKSGGSDWDEDVEADLRDATLYDTDGYAVAKKLDDWSPDAELVEILDNAAHCAISAKHKLVLEWAAENQDTICALSLQFPVGTSVSAPAGIRGVVDQIVLTEGTAMVKSDGTTGRYVVELERLK